MRIFHWTLRLAVAAAMTAIPARPVHATSGVCIVMSQESAQASETVEGFKKHLAQQGVSAEIRIHSLSRDGQQPKDIAQSLNQARAGYLLALGSQAAQIVTKENPGVPVIAGLVFSAAEIAGMGNATGVFLDTPLEAQLAMIRRIFPKARRVGVLYSAENEKKIAEASKIGQKIGLSLAAQEAFAPKEIPAALEAAGKNADVLWGMVDKVVLAQETAKQILLFSLRNELPFVGPSENWAKAGAAAAFGWNFEDMGVQCAEILLKLILGAKVAEIAAVGPRKMEYTLNLKTAEQMKIEFGPEVVSGAKRLFKGE
jgi:putative ABC transport system substrate-binding protein